MKSIFKSLTFWLILALIICAGCIYTLANINAKRGAEIVRLSDNQTALLGEVEHYKGKNGELVTSVMQLTMQRDEFSELFEAERRKVENLGIRIAELESLGEVTTDTNIDMEAEIVAPDTIYINSPILGTFDWGDGWVSITGELTPELVRAHIDITDTITIVAHRKARKWLFFRCKGKITHYDALSSNPHTTISNIRYIELTE